MALSKQLKSQPL